MSKPVTLVKRVLFVRNLVSTLVRFDLIPKREKLDNFNLDTKVYFTLFECKEFVERCIENGWIK